MRTLHAEHVAPEVVFTTEVPTTRKVVYLLVLVDLLKSIRFHNASPEYIPVWGRWDESEPSCLQRIYHAIVCVRRTVHLEW